MVVEESVLRDLARLLVWYPLRWGVSALSPSRALPFLGLLGKIHYHISPRKCRLIAGNLKVVYALNDQPVSLTDITCRYLENHYINQLLVFLFPRLNRNNIHDLHTFNGLERLEHELTKGKGCILLHSHFGPVHLPLFHLGTENYNVMQIGYLRKHQDLSHIGEHVSFRLREKLEQFIPAKIMQANRFLGGAFKHLRSNGILMMTGDGTGGGEFVGHFEPFPFLGKTMLFPVGPAKLATKTGASILPIFTIRTNNRHYYVTVIEPSISSKTTDQVEIMQRFIHLFESYIKRHPSHWHFWDEFCENKLLI